MKKVLSCLLFMSMSSPAFAGEYGLGILEPKSIFVDAYKNTGVHDPYLSPIDRDLGYGATFNVDFDLLRYNSYRFYALNKLHFDQSSETGRIVHAGWQYELGATLLNIKNPLKPSSDGTKLELFKQHHSRHILEDTRDAHFPVYDRVGIRFVIFK